MTKEYTFKAKIWLYTGKAAWHFITLPKDIATEIDYFFSMQKRGWGSLKTKAKIGTTVWETSIFPDKKSESYLMPVKSIVRKKEELFQGKEIAVQLIFTNE